MTHSKNTTDIFHFKSLPHITTYPELV